MADFEAKLRWLSERGNPVGAEELIERIEADLAGDHLVVVAKRREGTRMTKTEQTPRTSEPSRSKGPIWAVAAFVAVLAVGALLYAANSRGEGDVADSTTPPPPTTVAPQTTVAPDAATMTDLEVIEAGVAALYSGDGERAAELFELSTLDDDGIRAEARYQAAIGGRLTLNCTGGTAGLFSCTMPYNNAMTDAIGFVDRPGLRWDVVVEDGVITEFEFQEHPHLVNEMGTFLAMEGRFDGYQDCPFGPPFPESCAAIQMENLDAWAVWRKTVEPDAVVEFALESWYGGDCVSARVLGGELGNVCSTPDPANQAIEYESLLRAEVSLDACEETQTDGGIADLTCEVHYSNAMHTAVGKPPSVTVRGFTVLGLAPSLVHQPPGGVDPWYDRDGDAFEVGALDYPEDTELRESFRLFAEGGDLGDEYVAAGCVSARTPECANLVMDNLDAWATWYQTNS